MSDTITFQKPTMPLVESVFEAHGGFDLWNEAGVVHATLSTGGAAFLLKFSRDNFDETKVSIHLNEQRVEVRPYGGRDNVGHYDRNGVRIVDSAGKVIAERSNPRPYFRKARRLVYWDALDTLYFSGYACWNYFSMPYLLAAEGMELSEAEPWVDEGETWSRIDAIFPDTIETHSRKQSFYFDVDRRLRRHDYTAEVFGNWAKVAHYCHDHETRDGALFPMRRDVYPRAGNNKPRPFPTIIWIRLHDVGLGAA